MDAINHIAGWGTTYADVLGGNATRGFHGQYTITVQYGEHTVTQNVALPASGLDLPITLPASDGPARGSPGKPIR